MSFEALCAGCQDLPTQQPLKVVGSVSDAGPSWHCVRVALISSTCWLGAREREAARKNLQSIERGTAPKFADGHSIVERGAAQISSKSALDCSSRSATGVFQSLSVGLPKFAAHQPWIVRFSQRLRTVGSLSAGCLLQHSGASFGSLWALTNFPVAFLARA
jgi:hypothetical protein